MAPPITKDNVRDVQYDYTQYLGELIDEGMDYKEAKAEAQKRALSKYEELNYFLGEYNSPDLIKVRKTIMLEDLETLDESMVAGGWNNLSVFNKNSILYQLGCSVHRAGWWEEIGPVREGNKIVNAKFITSEERSDKAWLSQLDDNGNGVASDGIKDRMWQLKHHKKTWL
jgi:hypothetical protein